MASWDGTSWSAVGAGISSGVLALAAYDAGAGAQLYAGSDWVRRWDGTTWSTIGFANDWVRSLEVHDDGTGSALYAGGEFDSISGVAANRVARWNGLSWNALGVGIGGGCCTSVDTLTVHDDGSGPALYAAGDGTGTVRRWDGASWSSVGAGVGPGEWHVLLSHDDGNGPELYGGGSFLWLDLPAAKRVAKFDGESWLSLGAGVDWHVRAVAVYDDGTGPALYAGGDFEAAAGVAVNHVARWDGTSWSPLAGGVNDTVRAFAVYDAGAGPELYVGGDFWRADGLDTEGLARWDGTSWSAVGLTDDLGDVYALEVFDDGTGPALYVGGVFGTAGGVPASRIAKWDGASWSALGAGLDATPRALAVHDDGSGPSLFVGGQFLNAGGAPAARVARWDGTAWSALGAGLDDRVLSLAAFDDGGGPALFAGGYFINPSRIAKWDGTSWLALSGGGVTGAGNETRVNALQVYDDGSGEALYVGGFFGDAGVAPARRIARWDGLAWSGLSEGVEGQEVFAMTVYDAGDGPTLVAGGQFGYVIDTGDQHIGRWGGCAPIQYPSFCDGFDGALASCPCAPGAPDAGCDLPQGTGGVRLDVVAQETSPNGITMQGVGFNTGGAPPAVVIRSSSLDPASPVVFGDGLRCVNVSPLVRLGGALASGGVSTHAFGHGAMAGPGTFYYQLWFRSQPSTYCDPLALFNLSSGRTVTW